jgi:tetratricopeptide (TPR) repeat protein
MKKRISFLVLWAILYVGAGAWARGQSQTEHGQPATVVAQSLSAQASAGQSALAKAEQLYRTGQFEDAAQAYNAILQAEPRSVLAYVGLVRVYLKQKRPAEAYSAVAKAVEIAPSSEATRVAMGEVYFRQGKMAEAETEFAALIRQNTKEPRAYLGLSRVYRAASFYKHAKLMIDKAHALDAADPDIQRAWMGTLSLEERLKALRAYLAGEANDDAEQRRNLEEQLAVLQDEAGQAARPCRLTTKPGAMETGLDRLLYDSNHIRGYGLRVKLNDVSSRLLLDTGAGGILVNRKLAEKAGIKPLVQTNIKGIGDKGAAAGYVGYADSVKIGDLEFHDCYVEVMDKGSVAGEDGLIGADVFSRFLVDLDFPHAKFRLSELPPRPDEPAPAAALQSGSPGISGFHDRYIAPEMSLFTPVFRFGHQLLIPTKVNDLAPKLFIIDTGAFSNTISPAAAREVTKVSSDSELTVKGLNGTVKNVFRASELTLQFSHLRQKNLDIVAFDTTHISDSVGTEVSGMLGFSMLWMLEIKIDYRDGLVDFVYDASRPH